MMEQIKLKVHLVYQCFCYSIMAGVLVMHKLPYAWFTASKSLRKLKHCGKAWEVTLDL